MGFQLRLVISSPVPPDARDAIFSKALKRWPGCRGPRAPGSYPDRVVFACPELTSYLFDTSSEAGEAEWSEALQVHVSLERELPEWSKQFPEVTFVCVEADCFGGHCDYSGYACRNGQILESIDRSLGGSFWELLTQVDIELESLYFEPFVRGYFAGKGSGGFD